MYLERLTGRKSEALEDLENEALVVELKNGKAYGGRLDEYYYNGGGVIALYSCKLLDKRKHKWIDHDIMVRRDGKLVAEYMPDFWLSEIDDIFLLPEEYRDEIGLNDTLQIYIDPHYNPPRGITCHWDPGQEWENKNHSQECDGHLHEALTMLLTATHGWKFSDSDDKDKALRMRMEENFAYLRRRLLTYGARIP